MDKAVTRQREDLYRFLGNLYLWEVDLEQLKLMQELVAPQPCAVELWDDGWRELTTFLRGSDESCLDVLAVDYARTFLAAGVAQGQAAFPYESVYTDRQRQLGGVSGSELSALYASKGLKPDENDFKVPNDHIGLELIFMAHLCRGTKAEQQAFLENHLWGWYAGFCRDVQKYARTDFYKAVAKITAGFMELENKLLREEGVKWDTD